MTRSRRNLHRSGLAALGLWVSLGQGCARWGVQDRGDAGSIKRQALPFHEDNGPGAEDGSRPALPGGLDSAVGQPFSPASRSRTLPAGALLTVRLQDGLTVSRLHAGDSFTAFVAAPLAINGETLIPIGEPVHGQVECIYPPPVPSQPGPHPGYLRLTINSIGVAGKSLRLQTSSLFAPATIDSAKPAKHPPTQALGQERRLLTFRLSAPVTIAEPWFMARR